MADAAVNVPAARRSALARAYAALRDETARVRLALGVVALHVADDNFLQPEPGPSAGDHLASGLVPIAILAAVAYLYPRARAGARAATAMTFGALAWIVAMIAAAVAFRRAGASWLVTALVGLAALFAVHPPPVGAVRPPLLRRSGLPHRARPLPARERG